MLSSVFKIPEKSINNNSNNATTNTTELNLSHKKKEVNKFNSLDDGKEDLEFTVIRKSLMKLPSFRLRFDQMQTID